MKEHIENTSTTNPEVCIIGCGLSGIVMALELKKRLGVTPRIYEKAGRLGGTWRDNIYPGCACDIPSHWYSLSTELNPNWSSKYPGQEEILAYWDDIYQKHGLDEITTFNTSFVRGVWDSSSCQWTVTFQPTASQSEKPHSQEPYTITCTHLISTVGGYSAPVDSPPDLTGLEDFKGEKWHSARWRYDIDLKGKRVGVVGNGCSAAQFVPQLVNGTAKGGGVGKNGKVIQFMRTPNWFFPRGQHPYSPLSKWVFGNIPGAMRSYRAGLITILDARWLAWPLSHAPFRKSIETISTQYMKLKAPKKYHDALIPRFPWGCKRVILNPGYLECLHRPNIDLISDTIDRVTENGIRLKNGTEHEFDVLVLGTGFDLSERGVGLDLKGVNSESLIKRWESQGGPQAYLGTTVSGFPNFYMVLGPNVITGHSSVIASTEAQVNYIIKMLAPTFNQGVRAFELKPEVEEEYNVHLHKKLKNTVWQGGCKTYYNVGDKTVATWPGTSISFALKTRNPNFKHYRQVNGGNLNIARIQGIKRKRCVYRLLSLSLLITSLAVLVLWKRPTYLVQRTLT